MSAVELPDVVTEKLAEHLDRRHATLAEAARAHPHLVERAMYAARAARNEPKMLMLMDKIANILDHWSEGQNGQTRRQASRYVGEKAEARGVQAWREAFRCADEKKDAPEFGYHYLACAEYLGLVS
jgi:hypothetical protein